MEKKIIWIGIPDCDGNMLYGIEKILERQVKFYKELFRSQDVCEEETVNGKLRNEAFWVICSISWLPDSSSEMKVNKGPGPDGIASGFYKRYWE